MSNEQSNDYKGELLQLDAVEQALSGLRNKYATVPDVTTKDGYAACNKGIREITSYRTSADKLRKEITKPHRDFIDRVNNYGKTLIEDLQAIEQPLKKAKKNEDERAEREKQARIAKLRERINMEIWSFLETTEGLNSSELADLHSAALGIETDGYFDVTDEAEDAKAQVLKRISDLHSQRLDQEQMAAMQAEMEAERRRLREEEEAREAERQELEELRRFKAEQEAQRQAEEVAQKPKPTPEPEPDPLPAAAERAIQAEEELLSEARLQRASEIEQVELVTITRKEYDRLLEAEAKLMALIDEGVENYPDLFDAMQQVRAA